MPSALIATLTVTNSRAPDNDTNLFRFSIAGNSFICAIRDPQSLNATQAGFIYEMLATRITKEPEFNHGIIFIDRNTVSQSPYRSTYLSSYS